MKHEDVVPGQFNVNIGGIVVRVDGPWIVAVTPMLFNDRITLTHEEQYPVMCAAGYCYDKGVAAHAAAAVWNPLAEEQPAGYKKIAFEDRDYITDKSEAWLQQL